LELVPTAPDSPAQDVEHRELGQMLGVFSEQLPTRQREIVDLVELQGLSGAEAYELLDIEPVSVRAHLFKARKRLRSLILKTTPELVEDLP
jgi:RNA polymerase sigma-70 factor (ECF subfamily)